MLANMYVYMNTYWYTQVEHQQQLQKLEDDMNNKAAEYERCLKAAKEDAEKSMKWSHVSTCWMNIHRKTQSVITMKFLCYYSFHTILCYKQYDLLSDCEPFQFNHPYYVIRLTKNDHVST